MKNIRLAIACLALATSMPSVLHAQAAGAAAVQDSKEIALDPKWMPDRRAMSEISMKAMAFYARAALDGAEPGKEIIPAKILFRDGWDLDWLMPLKEAEKKLPPGTRMQMGSATLLINATWPQKSIYVKSGQGKFLMPGWRDESPVHAEYLEIYLICDQKKRLIGVQFRADSRKDAGWNSLGVKNMPPMKAAPGRRLPMGGMPMGGMRMEGKNIYHDLMMLGMNIDGQDVPYQIVRNRDNSDVVVLGMTCIHTYLNSLGESGNHKRNVRLYVGAPFARKIADIAEMYETGKAPAR